MASGADVKGRVPFGAIAGCDDGKNHALLLFAAMKLRAWPLSSTGPARRPVAQPVMVCGPASSSAVIVGPFVKLGASFTGAMVTVTVAAPELIVASLALKVNVSVPLASGFGV